MEQLLKDEVDSLLKSRQAGNKLIGPFPQVELPFFDVADATFDVVDSKQGGGPVVKAQTGTATYVNVNGYTLRLVRYDDYLSGYDASKYSRGIGRCDYLVFDVDGRCDYFLLNELCEGSLQNKKAAGIHELARTVQFLSGSDRLKEEIATYRNKLCYLSVKERPIKSPGGMADAFNNAIRIIPPIYTLTDKRISNAGFSAYVSCRIMLDNKPIVAQPLPKRGKLMA